VGSGSNSRAGPTLGYFYGSVTKALGFIPQRHEGKILGLAAHCKKPESYSLLRSMIDADTSTGAFIGRMERGLYIPRFQNPALVEVASGFVREDVAAAAQQALEEVVCLQVAALGSSARRIALAGGVFANVKLNQRIAELPAVEEVFVFPNMGDGGLCAGAAWLAHAELTGRRPEALQTCYLGPTPGDAEIVEALEQSGLAYRRSDDIHRTVGDYLAEGKVVARCTGPMEFGPRALGHRSILYQAGDPRVNRWLNDQLKRSEFMPFAPASLNEESERLYVGLDRARTSAKFMTITFDCTPYMKSHAAAAVHVDGTARPQLVTADDHPDLFAILKHYRARTGEPTVINTSFNMHEEPIVCTAVDAVRAFVGGGLDVLALGNYIVERDERVLSEEP
jgi:carbamoyltransferase